MGFVIQVVAAESAVRSRTGVVRGLTTDAGSGDRGADTAIMTCADTP